MKNLFYLFLTLLVVLVVGVQFVNAEGEVEIESQTVTMRADIGYFQVTDMPDSRLRCPEDQAPMFTRLIVSAANVDGTDLYPMSLLNDTLYDWDLIYVENPNEVSGKVYIDYNPATGINSLTAGGEVCWDIELPFTRIIKFAIWDELANAVVQLEGMGPYALPVYELPEVMMVDVPTLVVFPGSVRGQDYCDSPLVSFILALPEEYIGSTGSITIEDEESLFAVESTGLTNRQSYLGTWDHCISEYPTVRIDSEVVDLDIRDTTIGEDLYDTVFYKWA